MSDKYEEIIKQLRETEPVLEYKKELSDSIISKIKAEKLLSKERSILFTLVIRPAMTAAAVFLIGLFLFEQANNTSGFTNAKISKDYSQNSLMEFQQTIPNEEEFSEELKHCINEAKFNSKKIDRKCAIKLFMLYKKREIKEIKTYKQRLKNWFNH